jgi:hypothetical protein
MPEPEEPGMQGQSVATEAFRVGGLADFLYAQDIAFEVSPAELALPLVVLQVTGAAVAAKDSGEYFTQQLNQHFGSAREGDLIEDEVRRHQSPEPALVSAGPDPGRRLNGLLIQDKVCIGLRQWSPVSSLLITGSRASCFSSSVQGSATASLASSHEF